DYFNVEDAKVKARIGLGSPLEACPKPARSLRVFDPNPSRRRQYPSPARCAIHAQPGPQGQQRGGADGTGAASPRGGQLTRRPAHEAASSRGSRGDYRLAMAAARAGAAGVVVAAMLVALGFDLQGGVSDGVVA